MGKYDAELAATANFIATPGKGILAADESTGTIGQRFSKINIENNEDHRREYRDLLLNTDHAEASKYISGVILFDETFNQKDLNGTPFPEVLKKANIVTGIKVDKGTVNLPYTNSETATQGLDDLGARCKKYYEGGARFAKWRAVLKIDVATGCPTEQAVQENAHGLARYAAICQENGLVPIVEPEVLMDGEHTIEVSAAVTERVLAAVFKALNDHHVLLEGILLKPNMVLAGTSSAKPATPEEVAKYTVRTLQRTVPAAVPGIVFLSGGQSELDATANLHAINTHEGRKPWTLSFSYGRALQSSVLKTWLGDKANVEAARKVYLHRARCNGLAVLGKYPGEEKAGSAAESLYVKNYTY
jgi:fructose-bisphosphate aldolase class I